MTLAAVAFAVCLLAGAVLFVGTRPLERLRPGALAAVVSSHSGAPALPFIAATTLAGLWLAARLSKLAPDAREPRGRGLRR